MAKKQTFVLFVTYCTLSVQDLSATPHPAETNSIRRTQKRSANGQSIGSWFQGLMGRIRTTLQNLYTDAGASPGNSGLSNHDSRTGKIKALLRVCLLADPVEWAC